MRALWMILLILPMTALGAPPRLAVLELNDRADLSDAEVDYLTDLVRGVAGARGDLFVMTRENMLELLPPGVELAACEGACEVETGRRLGADFVVSGEVVRFASELRAVIRLHATRSGALLASERAGAADLGGLEGPIEGAAEALLARTGAGGHLPLGAIPARPTAITPAIIGPRAAPRLPPALFFQREPMTASHAEWTALDRALAPLTDDATPQPVAQRARALERRGLLAWRFAATETVRAFEQEDRCLAQVVDATGRTRCAAERGNRVRATDGALDIAATALAEAAGAPVIARADDVLFAAADVHRVRGDVELARTTLQMLETRHPDSPRAADGRLLLGVMFFDEGRDQFAEPALRRVIDTDKGAAAALYARYLLAWTFIRRGKPRPAISHLGRVLRETADARADHAADRPWALVRREARIDLVRAWADRPRARVDKAFALFAEIDPPGDTRLPEMLAEMYTVRGRRADARAVVDRLRSTLQPRCGGGDAYACGALTRLCARHGGAACRAGNSP